MKEKRTSNKLKQKQLETKHLEEQTKKMEDKLTELKRQIEEQKKMRSQMKLDSTVTRWQKSTKAANNNVPLKSYAKQILEEQKQAYNQFGISQKKIYGTKTFESALKQIRVQKQVQEDRNPTKINTFLKQPQLHQPVEHQNVLENNFFKAKMDVKSLLKQKTLQEFLEENYILQYLGKFREEQINDLQTLRYISRQQLNQMGVKAGHQVKIIKKIKEEFDKMTGNYQQPILEKTGKKVQFGYGDGEVNSYDEAQPATENIASLELNSKIDPPDQDDYAAEEQDLVLITAPMHSTELQVQEAQRKNCYECYRLVLGSEWSYEQKYFCSQACLQRFISQLRKNCPVCGRNFLKTEGFREQGLWFCSLGCCPNQEQIEQMFLQWHRRGQ